MTCSCNISYFYIYNTFSILDTHCFKYLADLLHFHIVEEVKQKIDTLKQREKEEKKMVRFQGMFQMCLNRMPYKKGNS